MAKISARDVVDTSVLVNNVLAVCLIIRTTLLRISYDGNVLPFRGVPVRVVVALLRALVAVAVAGGVLTGVNCRVPVSSNLLRCLKETFVAFAILTILVRLEGFMASEAVIYVAVAIPALILVLRDCIGGCTIAHAPKHRTWTLAHVLQNDVALEVGVVAAVLSSPLYRELRANVVLVSSNIDATTAVILGIKQTIRVVAISVGLIQPDMGCVTAEMRK